MSEKVLVLDCWTNKALSVVQSLGEKGLIVHAASHTRISPPLYSRYVQKRLILKNPFKEPIKYKHQLMDLLKGETYSCLIPLEVESIRVILDNREEIEGRTNVCLPRKDDFERANDKWEVLQTAKRINVPIPKSYCPYTDQEIHTAIKELGFPLVIKPRRSSGGRGLKTVFGAEDFYACYHPIKKKYGSPVLQERIPVRGQAVAVGALFMNSKSLALFSYKRIREFPVDGGPSTLRESTDDPRIKALAEKLLKELNWHGVAMVEFKMDPRTNTPTLMEVNPRFWGSLQLARVSGLNFPYAYYLLSRHKKLEKLDYKTGMRSRWLIPGDIAHFLSNKDRFRMEPSFFQFFEKNTLYDQLSLKDMRATIAVIVCYCLNLFNPEIWRMGVFRR